MTRWCVTAGAVLLCMAPATLHGQALPDIAATDPDMRTVRTSHYQIVTDLEPALADDMSQRLEALHAEYSRRLDSFSADDAAAAHNVYLLERQSDFQRLTGAPPGVAGGFLARLNVLAAFIEGHGRDGLRKTLQHEAFHQFAHNAISENIPPWLDEGLAEFFEEGIWTGEGFLVGQVPPFRIRLLENDVSNRRLIPFRQIMSFSREQWNRNVARDPQLTGTQYNQSWAMVHFLVNGSNGTDLYRTRLIHMLQLLHEGKPGEAAFAEAFSDNIEGFQKRFVDYVATLVPTDEATMVERQFILGSLLAFLDEEGRHFDDIESFRQAVVEGGYRREYEQGELKWQSEPGEFYFRDRNGRFLGKRNLYLDPRAGAPLPDIVCRSGSLQFRTRFYKLGSETDFEVVIESR